jgi:hypothetical protein
MLSQGELLIAGCWLLVVGKGQAAATATRNTGVSPLCFTPVEMTCFCGEAVTTNYQPTISNQQPATNN